MADAIVRVTPQVGSRGGIDRVIALRACQHQHTLISEDELQGSSLDPIGCRSPKRLAALPIECRQFGAVASAAAVDVHVDRLLRSDDLAGRSREPPQRRIHHRWRPPNVALKTVGDACRVPH